MELINEYSPLQLWRYHSYVYKPFNLPLNLALSLAPMSLFRYYSSIYTSKAISILLGNIVAAAITK